MTSVGQTITMASRPDDLESVILVDADNNAIGSCGKIDAHREGMLHRAFSIMITNQDSELLLQRRAAHKYHFANRWSNACCSHPRPGEPLMAAARRRLKEELGFVVPLVRVAELTYRAVDPASGLIEHEYLHLLLGRYAGEPSPNPDEVEAVIWLSMDGVRRDLARHPGGYTPWFPLLIERLTPEK